MADLFGIDKSGISRHLKKVFESGELNEGLVVAKIAIPTQHGAVEGKIQHSPTNYYNLDAIISIGYRVDSIRASERRIWQQITDIFAECSIDYDKKSVEAIRFFAMVQNKFHFSITGQTAAEIVYYSANHAKDNMGLTTWKNAPDGRILKSDTVIAKNYLSNKEIQRLERAVSGYFDYIEDIIERENTFSMKQFSDSINRFLAFREYKILQDNGKISHEQAKKKAESEYDIFNVTQSIDSDFDQFVKQLDKGR